MSDVRPAPSQSQKAYAQLRDLIVTGGLAPGSMHLEVDVAQMLGMSRTPVHEAAILLESQGLVEVRPRRGILIRPISPEDMAEIYEILTELEPLAASKLAQTRPDAATLRPLEAATDAMDAALAVSDRHAWAVADAQFHESLVALAGNRRLQDVVNMFALQVHRARLLTLSLRPEPRGSNKDHRDLLDALRAGDPDRAHLVHRDHRAKAKDLLIGLLNKHGFKQV